MFALIAPTRDPNASPGMRERSQRDLNPTPVLTSRSRIGQYELIQQLGAEAARIEAAQQAQAARLI